MIARELPNNLVLSSGGHKAPGDGFCVMEAVSYIAGEPWSDTPQCTCPVIAAFLRSWNDAITNQETRTRLLVPLIPLVVGTRNADVEFTRSMLCVDWGVREWLPSFLELDPACVDSAKALREYRPIVAWEDFDGVIEIVQDAKAKAVAAWDTATAAAMTAAIDAAKAATWGAARDAAMAAARTAAKVATWGAATAAAMDAAMDAARVATIIAAWDAAWDAAIAVAMAAAMDAAWATTMNAAWTAAWTAWTTTMDASWTAALTAAVTATKNTAVTAARDAARTAAKAAAIKHLQPTVDRLQQSAVDLVKRMCAVGTATQEPVRDDSE